MKTLHQLFLSVFVTFLAFSIFSSLMVQPFNNFNHNYSPDTLADSVLDRSLGQRFGLDNLTVNKPFAPGENVTVEGFLDFTKGVGDYFWPIPQHHVHVYMINTNPANNLTIIGGTNIYTSGYSDDFDNIDDYQGIINKVTNTTGYNDVITNKLSGYYNLQFQIPDQPTLEGLGITNSLHIIEYYPGNVSSEISPWIINEYDISLANTAVITAGAPSSPQILSDGSLSIEYQLTYQGGGPIAGIPVNVSIFNVSDSTVVCEEYLDCYQNYFNVTSPGITDVNGNVTIDILMVFNSSEVVRGTYGVNVTALTSPPAIANQPWVMQFFTIVYNNATISMVPSLNPMKPHENNVITVSVTSDYDISPISSIPLEYQLFYQSNSSLICNNAVSCFSKGFTITNAINLTDAAGQVSYTLTADYQQVNDGAYVFNVTGTFTSNVNPFITNQPEGSLVITIDRNPQVGQVNLETKTPDTTIFRPGENVTIDYLTLTNVTSPGPYANVPMIVELWNLTGIPAIISSGTFGLSYTPSSVNSSGSGNFSVLLDSQIGVTPVGDYRLRIIGDYSSFLGVDQYLQNANSTPADYDFSIDNLYDNLILNFIQAIPSSTSLPTLSGDSIDVVIQAIRDYNATWETYTGNPDFVIESNMRINPSFLINTSGIVMTINTTLFPTDIVDFYKTNGTGHLVVTITSTFPTTYLDLLKTLNFVAGINTAETPFLRHYNTTLTLYTTSYQLNQVISVNPDYQIVDVFSDSPATNATGDTYTLGTAIELYFIVRNTNNNTPLANFPVRFEITDYDGLSGIYLNYPNGTTLNPNDYILSDGSGQITIHMNSTYGITAENLLISSIQVTATVNLTLYNGGIGVTIPGPPYHIGESNGGPANYNLFTDTWSTGTSKVFFTTVYNYGEPVWSISDSEIRPGENINATVTVTDLTTPADLSGFRFPVNATIQCYVNEVFTSCLSIGVSLSVADTGVNPLNYTDANGAMYYLTDTNAQITFTINSVYNINYPKFFIVRLNATVDFENKTNVASVLDERFVVGFNIVNPYNLSQSSFSTNGLQNITYDPQYLTASIQLIGVSVPSLGGGTTVVPADSGVTLEATFQVTLDVIGNPVIQGVDVSINTTLVALQNVTLISSATLTTNPNGEVTFLLNVTTATEDSKPFYGIQATVDFLNNDTAMISPLDPINFNRPISHHWINGTTGDISISFHNDDSYRVLRQRLMVVNILAVYDTGDNQISIGPTNVIAYRGYKLELNVSYIKTDLTPVDTQEGFIVYYNQSLNTIVQIGSGTTVGTSGYQEFNTTLPGAGIIYAGSAQLYAEPTDSNFNSTNTFFQPFNFRIKATPHFTGITTDVTNAHTLLPNASILITGALEDEFNTPITNSTVLQSAIDELTTNILVYGTNQAQSVIYSGNVSTNLTASGDFSISYTIPSDFTNENISLRIELNSIASILSFDTLNATVQTVFTYQYVILSVVLDSDTGGGPFPVIIPINDSNYNIDGSFLDYYALISIDDNYGRPLQLFSFILNDNSTTSVEFSDTVGENRFDLSPSSEYINSTREFNLTYNNASSFEVWRVFINRTVYDITAPFIAFTNPNPGNPSSYSDLFNDFPVVIDAYDFNSTHGSVTTGLNQGSFIIYHNGSSQGILVWQDSDTYQYVFDFTSLPNTVTAINITIVITDNAGLTSQRTLIVTFDRSAPIINSITPADGSYPYQIGPVTVDTTDINLVSTVVANVSVAGVYTTYDLAKNPGNPNLWERQISFDSIIADAIVEFNVTDFAGNWQTVTYTYLIDSIDPGVSLTNITNSTSLIVTNDFTYQNVGELITIIATITENQSGINATNDITIPGISNLNINNVGNDYTISFNASKVTVDTLYSLSIADRAGNSVLTPLFTILADNGLPRIVINSPTNISTQLDTFNIDITLTDLQTDINVSSIVLVDLDSNPITFTISPVLNGYQILASTTPNFDADIESQTFSVSVSDSYDNVNTTVFVIFTDITSPIITGSQIKSESDEVFADIPVDYVTKESHTIKIEYNDGSTGIVSGIDDSSIDISLSYSEDGTSYVNVDFVNDDRYNIEDSSTITTTTIIWETGLGSNEVPEGQYKWLITVFDNVGHTSVTEITYTITYDRPSLIDQLISLGTTLALSLGIFGALGIGVAWIYEKVRYEK